MSTRFAERLREVLPERIDFEALIQRSAKDVQGPVTVISDVHTPFINERLYEEMLENSAKAGSTHLFIVGDLFNNGNFSRHAPGLNGSVESVGNTRDVTHDVLDMSLEVFNDIDISAGNHDEWMIKHNEGHLTMLDLIRWVYPEGGIYEGGVGRLTKNNGHKTITVHELPTVRVNIDGVPWVFEHPGFYSRIRTNVPRKVAEKYGMNAATGHTHHWGVTVTDDGKHYAVELGGMYDPRYFDYPKQKPTNMPAMVPGYAIIDGSGPRVFRG